MLFLTPKPKHFLKQSEKCVRQGFLEDRETRLDSNREKNGVWFGEESLWLQAIGKIFGFDYV